MSKIDEYRIAQDQANRFKAFLDSACDPKCDKFGAVVLLKDTYKGYYGSSSCSSWPDDLIIAVGKEMTGQLRGFIRAAAQTAEKTAETARKAAETEAYAVLKITQKEAISG